MYEMHLTFLIYLKTNNLLDLGAGEMLLYTLSLWRLSRGSHSSGYDQRFNGLRFVRPDLSPLFIYAALFAPSTRNYPTTSLHIWNL